MPEDSEHKQPLGEPWLLILGWTEATLVRSALENKESCSFQHFPNPEQTNAYPLLGAGSSLSLGPGYPKLQTSLQGFEVCLWSGGAYRCGFPRCTTHR